MGCRGPKAETRWSEPILLRTGTCGTATPPRVPCPCLVGVLARGTASALRHHPKTRGRNDPRSPHPSHHLLPAASPSTIAPAPARRGSAVVVIASILASLGAVLATAVLGALGYEGLLGGTVPAGASGEHPNSTTPSAKKLRSF